MSDLDYKPGLTKRDLATFGMEALDKTRAGQVQVSRAAGGVSFASALEVMEFAKLMAVADKAVPKHLRNNAGACLRIVFQAVEWQMSPWAVADKSYEVNDRIAYESQLIHAVIEARAPLRERLLVEYIGEVKFITVTRSGEDDKGKKIEWDEEVVDIRKSTRACKVIGKFLDGTTREYESPFMKNIKVKNSPLWSADPDQQLFYYASRSWARKWCPDVLMGLYTKEELAADPTLGRDPSELPGPGLHARLVGSEVNREEGHKDGHTESALVEAATGSSDEGQDRGGAEPEGGAASVRRTKTRKRKAEVIAPPPAIKVEDVKNSKQWAIYCAAWLKEADSAVEIGERWAAERKLRNGVGVTKEERDPVEKYMMERVKELGGEE